MRFTVGRGPAAQPEDLRIAEAQLQLLANQLPRIRATALAWRNGLAALLAALIGFGLIKGRSDVGELASPYNVVVGVLLAASLLAGGIAAERLLRAAHGQPRASKLSDVLEGSRDDPLGGADRIEAIDSADALNVGFFASYACAVLLCAAVGLTWYGPGKDDPHLRVRLDNGAVVCGDVLSVDAGQLRLETPDGQMKIDLNKVVLFKPVEACTPPPADP